MSTIFSGFPGKFFVFSAPFYILWYDKQTDTSSAPSLPYIINKKSMNPLRESPFFDIISEDQFCRLLRAPEKAL